MQKIIFYIAMSLDGYITDKAGDVGLLYQDIDDDTQKAIMRQMIDTTGAVVMGRNTFDMGKDAVWDGKYEFQTPIFVITEKPPKTWPRENGTLKFHAVADGVESALRQAKTAAAGKNVMVVGGANVVQQLIQLELLDELHIRLMPMILNGGLRLFDNIPHPAMRLKQRVVTSSQGYVHLEYTL